MEKFFTKLEQLINLVRQRDEIDRQINLMIRGDIPDVEPKKRKYRKRFKKEDSDSLPQENDKGEDWGVTDEKKKKTFARKSCCGSSGPRHKKDCSKLTGEVETKKCKCLKCGFVFLMKGKLLDAFCPDCGKCDIALTTEEPITDQVYDQTIKDDV